MPERNEIERYSARAGREMTRRARAAMDEVRLKQVQAQGAMILAEHLMEGMSDLELYRRSLVKGDVGLNMITAEFMETGIQQGKRIQRSLDPWGV